MYINTRVPSTICVNINMWEDREEYDRIFPKFIKMVCFLEAGRERAKMRVGGGISSKGTFVFSIIFCKGFTNYLVNKNLHKNSMYTQVRERKKKKHLGNSSWGGVRISVFMLPGEWMYSSYSQNMVIDSLYSSDLFCLGLFFTIILSWFQ